MEIKLTETHIRKKSQFEKICICLAPQHLLCAYGNSSKKEIQNTLYILLTNKKGSKTSQQLINTASYLAIPHYSSMKISQDRRILNRAKNLLRLIIVIKAAMGWFTKKWTLIFADERNVDMWILKLISNPKTTIILDDGLNTYYDNCGRHNMRGSTIFMSNNSVSHKCIYLLDKILKNKVYFKSIYSKIIDSSKYEENLLGFLKIKFEVASRESKEDANNIKTALFLGGGLSDNGTCSLRNEVSLVKAISNYFTAKGLQFKYMAKSKSMDTKLIALRSEGICVLRSSLPAELYILEEIKAGRKLSIISLGSTAMRVLSIINANVDLYGVEIDGNFMINKLDKLESLAIAEYFKKEPQINVLRYNSEIKSIKDSCD